MSESNPLVFKVAPHIVEDLGLNLYTTLPRVLVEFVANAYDADSPSVDVEFDPEAIHQAREVIKARYELEKVSSSAAAPLETRMLPDSLTITIRDSGHGMGRADLDQKFLFAGRRRRRDEPSANGRSPNGRPLMGRKGLGKLAGFGVAKTVRVRTRKAGEAHATEIELNYDDLVKVANVHEIQIPERHLADGGGIATSGTTITLSRLLYDPLKSRVTTIEKEIGYYFSMIEPSEFEIRLNGVPIVASQQQLAYAWPEPTLPVDQFVEKTLPREGGGEIKFTYRMRFTGKNEALEAAKRGVRVYAHKRLAAAPSLLHADTNMHGFRMTDYLDGVVHADFIDEEEADYISTDRESLRWESPLLSPLYLFLSEEIKEACKRYQKKRDTDAPNEVKDDAFTIAEIDKYELSARQRKMALKFAVILEKGTKRGVADPVYKSTLPQLVRGIGHGSIVTAIAELAAQANPELTAVAYELVRLTKDELDQFTTAAKGRLSGIAALKKIVERPHGPRKESELQLLFEECPWLVDATYSQFLVAADVSLATVFKKLATALGIEPKPTDGENRREPDLVFLIGSLGLREIVIVELKDRGVTLQIEHLNQLEYYMERAAEWLAAQQMGNFRIRGELIGKMEPDSIAQGAVVLRKRIKDSGPDTMWRVRTYLGVLSDAEAAHRELIDIQTALEKTEPADGEESTGGDE